MPSPDTFFIKMNKRLQTVRSNIARSKGEVKIMWEERLCKLLQEKDDYKLTKADMAQKAIQEYGRTVMQSGEQSSSSTMTETQRNVQELRLTQSRGYRQSTESKEEHIMEVKTVKRKNVDGGEIIETETKRATKSNTITYWEETVQTFTQVNQRIEQKSKERAQKIIHEIHNKKGHFRANVMLRIKDGLTKKIPLEKQIPAAPLGILVICDTQTPEEQERRRKENVAIRIRMENVKRVQIDGGYDFYTVQKWIEDCDDYQFIDGKSLSDIRDIHGNIVAQKLLELEHGHELLNGTCEPFKQFEVAQSPSDPLFPILTENAGGWIRNTLIAIHPDQFINQPMDFMRDADGRLSDILYGLEKRSNDDFRSAIFQHLDQQFAAPFEHIDTVLVTFARSIISHLKVPSTRLHYSTLLGRLQSAWSVIRPYYGQYSCENGGIRWQDPAQNPIFACLDREDANWRKFDTYGEVYGDLSAMFAKYY